MIPRTFDPNSTLVLGLGNPLMGDDGVGLAVLSRLQQGWECEGVHLVDGGTWGMNLLPLIEDTRRLLLLDAIRLGVEPGTLHLLTRDQLPRYLSHKLSPHQIDLKEILALAEFRGTLPEVAVALGVEPAAVELSTTLSQPVEARLEELTDLALLQLGQWGHSCRNKAPRVYA